MMEDFIDCVVEEEVLQRISHTQVHSWDDEERRVPWRSLSRSAPHLDARTFFSDTSCCSEPSALGLPPGGGQHFRVR